MALQEPIMNRMALAAFLAATALFATPSFAAPTDFDKCVEPPEYKTGSVNPRTQGRDAPWSSSGEDAEETVPGAPGCTVFVLHRR